MSSIHSKILLPFALAAGLLSCSPEKKAQKSFKFAKYERVLSYYRGVLVKQPNNPRANYYVAESYRLSNRIKEAEPFYAKIKGRGTKRDSIGLYYAKSLQANGKYDEAKKELGDLVTTTEDENIKDRAQRELTGLDYIGRLTEKKNYYRVKNLDAL